MELVLPPQGINCKAAGKRTDYTNQLRRPQGC